MHDFTFESGDSPKNSAMEEKAMDSGSVTAEVAQRAQDAKTAALALRTLPTARKNDLLLAVAQALEDNQEAILAANALDMSAGKERGMSLGLLDRLALTAERLADIAKAVRNVAELPDPVGTVVRGSTLPNGLQLVQKRVPMGVVGMIYEARPNVTVDAAVLCLKSGNAAILRGGSAAINSNQELVRTIQNVLVAQGLPAALVQTVDDWGRPGAVALMKARGLVDLVIPRGGAGLIQTVVREATVPVIETGLGNCHIYVDSAANLEQAVAIVLNSKTQRVGVCNAVETLLIHQDIATEFVPQVSHALIKAGVTIHACPQTKALAAPSEKIVPATVVDWATEYLSKDIAVKVVEDRAAAITHIRTYSTGHTDAILSESWSAINDFTNSLDSAAVIVNASTRFTDGAQFGLGAEIGISTQKLHARGPMGLEELTTTTWIVSGVGHVRE